MTENNLFSKPKSHLNVAWRGVYFAPSAQEIKAQVREKAKSDNEKRIQQEMVLKMYEIFGSGKTPSKIKSMAKLLHKGMDKEIDETESISDNAQEVVTSSISTKSPSRSDLPKAESIIKRKMSNLSINQGVDIRFRSSKVITVCSDIHDEFLQHRPVTYFGIRKTKLYDFTDEKERTKKMSIANNILTNIMSNQKSDADAKETSSRQASSIIQKHSPRPSKVDDDELQGKIVKINKMEKRRSTEEILSRNSVIDKRLLMSISNCHDLQLPDLENRISCKKIMDLYLSKYYKNKHPLRQDAILSQKETKFEHDIMTHCVTNNKLLIRLMNKSSLYPYKFQVKMAEIDAGLSQNPDEMTTKAAGQPIHKKLNKRKKSMKLTNKIESILDEIGIDIKEFNLFYLPLLEYSFDEITCFTHLENETDIDKIKKFVHSLGYTLSIHRNHPGSMVRIMTQQFIKAGEKNNIILLELIANVEGWLDQILKTFLSKFQSVRLEAFITIAYLFSKPVYVSAMQSHIFNEIMYDVVATILRCFDLKSEDYDMYYSLLGVIFHYAPSEIILDCLIERAPYSNHIEVVSKWPRFVYLAFKYWSLGAFNSSKMYLKRLIETLENHYIRESLSRKCLKEAATCICKRFNVTSTMFTTWPKHESCFPD